MFELKPHNMSKRQRRKKMIKEVDMPNDLATYVHRNDTDLKRSFNRLAAAMVNGSVEFNTGFLNEIGTRLKKEIADINYSQLTFWQKCRAFVNL